jgi:hypothetical protein
MRHYQQKTDRVWEIYMAKFSKSVTVKDKYSDHIQYLHFSASLLKKT